MSTDLELFTYAGDTHVRVLRDDEGEPLFVAADVARALGYRMASDMTRRLDDDERGTRSVRTPGGTQDVSVITEPGLYTAILCSQIPSDRVRDFKRWVTHEVLPSIRRTGSYSRYPAQPTALPSKKELAQWVITAEERAEVAEAKVLELTPPAAAWAELADAAGDYSVSDAAKVLSRDPNISTGERRLFKAMHDAGWIYRRDGRWKAYQTQVDRGHLREKVNEPFMRHGEMFAPAPTVRITPKGLAELHGRLGGSGQLALVAVS